jgi:phenylpropionate dioxygenase-like ring-hydroxylating dioxygenase large terminal subunit
MLGSPRGEPLDDRDWGDSLTDDRAFWREQQALCSTWTFLGLAVDLPRDNDWFRTSLAGRSVFVQRFGDEFVGFENICPHRFFPLRTADKGNGQIICGFHHWHFDRRGDAVGIPNCREVFGVTPREVKARLRPVEIATCGGLIFGRVDAAPDAESLEDFLAGSAHILAAFSCAPAEVQRFGRQVEANWRLMVQITLDDYHVPAMHKLRSHIRAADYSYWRFGQHSAMALGQTDPFPAMAEDCAAGRYQPTGYRIFSIFPNLAVSLFGASHYWYIHIQQFAPQSSARSQCRSWIFLAPFQTARETLGRRLTRPLTEPIRARLVRYSIERIGNEDHLACERLQQVAHQANPWQPLLGRQEERVGWFTEAYAKALSAG